MNTHKELVLLNHPAPGYGWNITAIEAKKKNPNFEPCLPFYAVSCVWYGERVANIFLSDSIVIFLNRPTVKIKVKPGERHQVFVCSFPEQVTVSTEDTDRQSLKLVDKNNSCFWFAALHQLETEEELAYASGRTITTSPCLGADPSVLVITSL